MNFLSQLGTLAFVEPWILAALALLPAIWWLLRATPPAQIRACAEAGEPMPQKSTYFFPKLCTGAVMLPLG